MTSRTTRGQSKHMNRLERAKPGTPYAPQRAAADGNHNSTASTEIIELPCQDLRSSSTGGTAPLAAPSALRQSTNGRDKWISRPTRPDGGRGGLSHIPGCAAGAIRARYRWNQVQAQTIPTSVSQSPLVPPGSSDSSYSHLDTLRSSAAWSVGLPAVPTGEYGARWR
jgi:hypothetical protein